jgi:uncharacterized membrane protein YkoI
MMRSGLVNLVVILLFSLSVASSCTLLGKKETVVTIAQVPPPVRSAIEKVTAGKTIKQIEKIESGGKVTYEVEYMDDGKERDAYFAEDGKIVKGVQ